MRTARALHTLESLGRDGHRTPRLLADMGLADGLLAPAVRLT